MTKNTSQDHQSQEHDDEFDQAAAQAAGETTHDDVLSRVLSRANGPSSTVFRDLTQAEALDAEEHDAFDDDMHAIRLEREQRASLKRVGGLSTQLEDISEVEYREVQLENVVLIGVYSQGSLADAENSLRELAALAETAGANVLDGVLQRRPNPDPATYFGKGKAAELRDLVASLHADTVIADSELAPSQRRALEDVVKVKVLDRTAVILDIFSQHAQSREGKAQVELAQLEYLLPRLRGWGESMSRQAGGQVGSGGAGMGSRGPGETKMELDRRKIHTRMAKLKREIAGMAPARETKRAQRKRGKVPSVAIAGYTNAGKSSLVNRLTGATELVQNQLFATLDTAVRSSETPDGRTFTYADTVGFVRNLPHQLVEAFRSTFEEVGDADVILHVVDASHPDPAAQLETVRDVIAEVDANDIPEIVVFNKSDMIDETTRLVLHGLEPKAVFASAKTGEGIDDIRVRIAAALPEPKHDIVAVIPYDQGGLVSELHEQHRVLSLEYEQEGTRTHALVSDQMLARLAPYLRDESGDSGESDR